MDPVVSTFAIIAGLLSVVLVLLAQTEVIEVPPYMSGYIFKKGQRVRILPSGTYRIWKWGKVIQYVDPRPFWVQVQGQELTTKDGAPIRVSVSVHLNVVNPEAMAPASSISNDIYAYVQLKLRDHVVSRTMEQVTEERQTINSALGEALTPLLAKWGLEINEIAIRDITLLGESKKAYAETGQRSASGKSFYGTSPRRSRRHAQPSEHRRVGQKESRAHPPPRPAGHGVRSG